MFPVLLLAASALTAPASAAEYKVNGSATVAEVAELQLYAGVDPADTNWYVEGKIGDKQVLLQLVTGGSGAEGYGLALTEGAAKRLGLKASGKENEQTVSTKVVFGSVTVSGKALITKVKPNVDGKITISAFPQLAWGIDATAGKVRIGPSGATSVASQIGAGSAYTQTALQNPVVGKKPQKVAPKLLLSKATISGVELPVEIGLGNYTEADTEVDGADWFKVSGVENPKYPLPALDGEKVGETEWEWREVTIGGLAVHTIVQREGAGLTYRFGPPARIGQEVLQHFDIGVDAGTHQLSLRPNKGVASIPYAPVLEARLKADLDAAIATPPPDPDAAKAALTGKLTPLYGFYAATDQWDQALAIAKRLTESDADHCSSWHAYGKAQLWSGNAPGAIEPLEKAAKTYQAWGVRPLDERTKLSASEAKRSKAANFDGVWAQPSSCYTAWSDLAFAHVASGNPAAVAALYPQYADLDSNLPLVAGNALLLTGNVAGAEAAYRQALQLSYTQSGYARGGMMLATRQRSIDLAVAQFQGPLDEEHGTLRYWLVYGELLRQKGGGGQAIAALTAALAKSPANIPGWLALATEQSLDGKDNKAAIFSASTLLADRLTYAPRVGSLHGWNAEALRLEGKLAEAAAEGEKCTTLDPANGLGWFVRARIAESAGDAPRAAELRKKAGQYGAGDPLYAALLANP